MLVAGLMSGTSADGIDVALVEIRGRGLKLRARLRHHCTFPYSPAVRRLLLQLANADHKPILSIAEISQTNFLLGELFAEAVRKACRKFRVPLEAVGLIGSHGHTVFHQPVPERLAGVRVGSTLQLGEAAVIAERTGIPVVSNFRPRDLAAGGEGAPLVPFVDYLLYRHPKRGRIALNLGGIANITVIPAGGGPDAVTAFDTGPGNMVIDGVVDCLTGGRQKMDRAGRLAARGRPIEPVLGKLLRHPYFRRRPPKSTGREQFGEEFLKAFLAVTTRYSVADRMRTATELTARALAIAYERFVRPKAIVHELIAGGGGVRNRFLMKRIAELLPDLAVRSAGSLGVNEKAKEAFAFAVLAYQTWNQELGTLPSATGARHAVPLGNITPGARS